MARPISKDSKNRREYVILCYDPILHSRKFFVREGYKKLLLTEYSRLFPDCNISIYVFSGSACANVSKF